MDTRGVVNLGKPGKSIMYRKSSSENMLQIQVVAMVPTDPCLKQYALAFHAIRVRERLIYPNGQSLD